MTRKTLGIVVVIALSAAGCGVPTGPDSFEAIDDDDVPNRLAETTTTTTSLAPTTSTVETTVATTQPDVTDSTTTSTTIPSELVEVFFLSRGALRPIPSPAPSPATANDLILLLENGPDDPFSPLLETLVEPGLIVDAVEDGGILTIELDDAVFQGIPSRDQRDVIAQMVLTFLTNLRGVGQAVFTIDDERLIVPVDSGQSTEEPVSLDDYESMRFDAPSDETPDITTTTTEGDDPTTTDPDLGEPGNDPES